METLMTFPAFEHVLAFIDSSRYALLFFACFFEGTIAMAAGGVLWALGSVSFWPMYLTLLAADITADTCWYLLGYAGTRHFLERWGTRVGVTPETLHWAETRFREHDTSILLFSKLTMGFGLAVPTLITAGTLRIPYPRFFVINTAGALAWVFMVVLVGFYWGNVLEQLALPLQIGLTALALAALAAAVHFGSRRLVRESR